MATHFGWIRRLAFGLFVASALVFSTGSLATNVQFVGSVAYSYVGNTAVLTANRVENFSWWNIRHVAHGTVGVSRSI